MFEEQALIGYSQGSLEVVELEILNNLKNPLQVLLSIFGGRGYNNRDDSN